MTAIQLSDPYCLLYLYFSPDYLTNSTSFYLVTVTVCSALSSAGYNITIHLLDSSCTKTYSASKTPEARRVTIGTDVYSFLLALKVALTLEVLVHAYGFFLRHSSWKFRSVP
jgi:hypothetical protein